MKFILLALLICFSNISFSQDIPKEKVADVIQAIKDSLAKKDLDCYESIAAFNFDASKIFWGGPTDTVITVNDGKQPALTIINTTADSEFDANLTTNADLTVVVGIKATVSTVTKTTKNTGTIVNPHYEDVITKKLAQNIECK